MIVRYIEDGPDRLHDSIMERYFITEKSAMTKMNEMLERAATLVESAAAENADDEGCEVHASTITRCIRALKENLR